MLSYLIVATAVAMFTTPTGYAWGSYITAGRIRQEQVAAERLALGVRRFVVAHLPRYEGQEVVVITLEDLERLHDLADECDQTTGHTPPPMPFTRRVLAASADRRSGRLTARLAA
jgi:hypothetical protein